MNEKIEITREQAYDVLVCLGILKAISHIKRTKNKAERLNKILERKLNR